jgi:uncharacterized membrane protein
MAYTVTQPAIFWTGLIENTAYACDFNSTFSCSSVFSKDFAWIFGLPFSLYALFVYPLIVFIGILWLLKKIKNHYYIILSISIFGVFFNGYIIYNEILISTYCFLCLICSIIILINWGISIKWITEKNNKITW